MVIKIRPLEENDAKSSHLWRNDSEVWKYTGSSPSKVITLDDETVWIKRVLEDDTSERFAIMADNVYVGNIYLTDIDDEKAEYHIFIGNKNYIGKGIAKQASKLIIDFAKNSLHLKSIFLQVRPENIRAVQLYTSLGFNTIKKDSNFLSMSIDI